MARTASRPRSSRSSAARQPSIRGLLIADALRSWVPPTVALGVLGVTMLLDTLEVVPDGAAAAIAVIASLVLGAFVATAPLLADDAAGRVRAPVAVAGAALWVALLAFPVLVRLFPGAPLRHVALDAAAKGALVVGPGEASRVDVVVDTHLPLASDRRDRTVHYDLDLVDDAGAHTSIAGELGDSWRMRRMGRRGSAPSHFEHLSAAHMVESGGRALRIAEVTVTGEHGASAIATVLRHRVPPVVLYVMTALLLAGALALEWWWDGNTTTMATMVTASGVAAVLVFNNAGAGHPGIRDVIGAALVGAVVGVPSGAGAAWLARSLLPRRSGRA